jgi:putative endonuclease
MPGEPGFTNWRFWKRWFGRRSERYAAKYLRKLGWRLVASNVSDTRGELDILALDSGTLVVVEVRSTAGSDPAVPAASVDLRKQRRITEAVLRFLARRKLLGFPVRFDVLAIAWPEETRTPNILHIRHAFEATGKGQMWS